MKNRFTKPQNLGQKLCSQPCHCLEEGLPVKRELENSRDVLLNAQIEIYDVEQTCLSEIWSEELCQLCSWHIYLQCPVCYTLGMMTYRYQYCDTFFSDCVTCLSVCQVCVCVCVSGLHPAYIKWV